MKTALSIIVALCALSSYSATFAWGTGNTKVSFGGTEFTTADTVATGYLVYLTNGTVSDLFSVNGDSITVASSVKSKANTTTGLASGKGKITDTYADTAMANGDAYGMYIIYNDGVNTWYNFSSTVYTASGITLGTESLTAASFDFNFSSSSTVSADKVSVGSGWQKVEAVPEPATGALALAGIALLFKRRKARA